jgi:predicted metal-dependent phosphoesterase TrpH
MGIRVDLHLHTTASDGRWPPERLVREVQEAGIQVFGVTDHDSLGSLTESAALARHCGLGFLPGIEFSSRLNGQLYHLLGYGIDWTNPDLVSLAQENKRRLLGASDEAVRLLAEAGYPVPIEQYDVYTWEPTRGGWKALNFLIDIGVCDGVRSYFGEVFNHELRHPEAEFPHPSEVIATIRRAGGKVVLAHPGAPYYNELDTVRMDQLVDMGLQGLECYSFHHSATETGRLLAYCQQRGLLVSGGSDCHGGFAGRDLGVPRVHLEDLRLGALAEQIQD